MVIGVISICSHGSSIFGLDTFQIGDHWQYRKYTYSGCCVFFPPMQYDIFSGIQNIRVVNKYIKTDSLFYICENTDSGYSIHSVKTFYGNIDSVIDSTLYFNRSIDSIYGIPFKFKDFYYITNADSQTMVQYQGDSVKLISYSDPASRYHYLEKIGFIDSYSDGGTQETRYGKNIVINSYNGITVDTAIVFTLGNRSNRSVIKNKYNPFVIRINKSRLILADVGFTNILKILITDMQGKQLESGVCMNDNSFNFKTEKPPGLYIVKIFGSSSDYLCHLVLK